MSSAGFVELANFSVKAKSVFEMYSEDSVDSLWSWVWWDRLGVFLPGLRFRPDFRMLRSSESFCCLVLASVLRGRESSESPIGWL